MTVYTQCTQPSSKLWWGKSCRLCASTHHCDWSFREYFSHALLVSVHESVGVFRYKNKGLFQEGQCRILFFSKSQMWPFDNVLLSTGCVGVCDLLQLCWFTADTYDGNTFLQVSQSPETTPSTVRKHVSMLDDALVILERLHGYVMAVITSITYAISVSIY